MADPENPFEGQQDISQLFAPAYIPGNQPSIDALNAWYVGRLTPEQKANPLVTPTEYDARASTPVMMGSGPGAMGGGGGGYGGQGINQLTRFGQDAGTIDPGYLQAMAWNTKYDYEGAKTKIAEAAAKQAAAKAAKPAPTPWELLMQAQMYGGR